MSTITLNNGFEMPVIGLGLWRLEKEELRNTILNAIKLGYRHFDAAGMNPSIPSPSSYFLSKIDHLFYIFTLIFQYLVNKDK